MAQPSMGGLQTLKNQKQLISPNSKFLFFSPQRENSKYYFFATSHRFRHVFPPKTQTEPQTVPQTQAGPHTMASAAPPRLWGGAWDTVQGLTTELQRVEQLIATLQAKLAGNTGAASRHTQTRAGTTTKASRKRERERLFRSERDNQLEVARNQRAVVPRLSARHDTARLTAAAWADLLQESRTVVKAAFAPNTHKDHQTAVNSLFAFATKAGVDALPATLSLLMAWGTYYTRDKRD